MPQLELIPLRRQLCPTLASGADGVPRSMTVAVAGWRERLASAVAVASGGLAAPSWRNNAWLAANPWFERELLPRLKDEVRRLI